MQKDPLNTIWRIPDDLWQIIMPLLPEQKAPGTPGRPPLQPRQVLNGILYVLRTGIQWKQIPKEFGSGSSVHRYFQQWTEAKVFEKLWGRLLEYYDEQVGIDWQWQSVDGALTKAPMGGELTGKNPTDRGKQGVKRVVLTDGRGVAVAVEITGANVPDMKMLAEVLERIVIERPQPSDEQPQHLCLDKGFDYSSCDQTVSEHEYIAHTRRKGEESPTQALAKHPARRWVVERIHSWYNRFRKILIRFEKKAGNYLALIDFASSLIVYRTMYRCSPTATSHDVLGVLG
jgi:putative transposase